MRLTDQVVFETGFTLERSYKVPKSDVRRALLGLLSLEGIVLPGKDQWREVLDLYAAAGISLVDAYHIIVMQRWGITEIYTFDKDFDGLDGITRIEP